VKKFDSGEIVTDEDLHGLDLPEIGSGGQAVI
jgi:serine/threonine protein kinase